MLPIPFEFVPLIISFYLSPKPKKILSPLHSTKNDKLGPLEAKLLIVLLPLSTCINFSAPRVEGVGLSRCVQRQVEVRL